MPTASATLTDRQQLVLDTVRAIQSAGLPDPTPKEIGERTGISPQGVGVQLRFLRKKKLLPKGKPGRPGNGNGNGASQALKPIEHVAAVTSEKLAAAGTRIGAIDAQMELLKAERESLAHEQELLVNAKAALES